MKDKVPVKNNSGFVRDMKTGAILSVDTEAVRIYEDRKKKINSDKDRLNKLETEIAELRQIIEELRKK